jgi:hypothetical protein
LVPLLYRYILKYLLSRNKVPDCSVIEASNTCTAYERRVVGTPVRDPESQVVACESMKGPIALAIDILF